MHYVCDRPGAQYRHGIGLEEVGVETETRRVAVVVDDHFRILGRLAYLSRMGDVIDRYRN